MLTPSSSLKLHPSKREGYNDGIEMGEIDKEEQIEMKWERGCHDSSSIIDDNVKLHPQ